MRKRARKGCAPAPRRNRKPNGFTVLELVSVLVIVGILAAMALNVSKRASDSTTIKRAVADLLLLQTRIDEFAMTRDRLPTSLSELPGGVLQDPWGNAYEYLPFTTAGMGSARRDRFLVPINTLYDLYSKGRDGITSRDLSDPASLDDVVRANDGAFMGLAIAY